MSYSFLVFDFGNNEEIAQQARHRIEAWRQGFRLDKKLQLKFDREEIEAKPTASAQTPKEEKGAAVTKGASKKTAGSKAKTDTSENPAQESETQNAESDIRVIVRLDFSDHEKLSRQRWLDRIPSEEPFKTVKHKLLRPGEAEYDKTAELFDSLD